MIYDIDMNVNYMGCVLIDNEYERKEQ